MNDNLLNETLDDLAAESGELDLGSFDGFDPLAESEQSEAPVAECDPPITESLEDNVTPLPQKNEAPLSSETATPAPKQVEAAPPVSAPAVNPLQQAIAQAEETDVKQSAAPLFSRMAPRMPHWT